MREIILVIATVCAALAAGFSAVAAFRLENATYITASRLENATYTTALYIKEVDAISTFFATAGEMDNLFVDLLGVYSDTFRSRDHSGLKTFPDKAESLMRRISDQVIVLNAQAFMMSIFVPFALSDHFYGTIPYYHENFTKFLKVLEYIDEQLHIAANNPKQQIVIDVADLRATQEQYFKMIEDEKTQILRCIKPALETGRPITAQSEVAGCLQKK